MSNSTSTTILVTTGVQSKDGCITRLCRVCLRAFWLPIDQDYVPGHQLELPDPTQPAGDWCHGSGQPPRTPRYGTTGSAK